MVQCNATITYLRRVRPVRHKSVCHQKQLINIRGTIHFIQSRLEGWIQSVQAEYTESMACNLRSKLLEKQPTNAGKLMHRKHLTTKLEHHGALARLMLT